MHNRWKINLFNHKNLDVDLCITGNMQIENIATQNTSDIGILYFSGCDIPFKFNLHVNIERIILH